ncbi:retinoic acid-induced protein 3 isoform X2 [Macrotis lagotis]|uniref:retinoic acid-induced protein 3 isoform X2 n=1 Tax=Macrotis lagotis TaxID=92651 RepID=UPI003D697B7E
MTSSPDGCSNHINSTYYNLCDKSNPWGIILETFAAAGVVTSIAFMLSLLILICKVQDSSRRKIIPTQFVFLLGVFGLFGLTFAFIIKLNEKTGPTRFFLFGVLFALCFSCLLAHTFTLVKLVRGKKPLSLLMILALALGFSLIQDIIAVEYVVITMNKTNTHVFTEMPRKQLNEDFVMLLIYVLFLMAFTFIMSVSTFCGSFTGWKRHGAHIYMTMLFSIAIWVAWITLLLHGTLDSIWNDTILSTVLVANGWVFLLMYILPEFILLTRQRNPRDYPMEDNFCKPQFLKQSYGMENRAYLQEEITQESGLSKRFLNPTTQDSLKPL